VTAAAGWSPLAVFTVFELEFLRREQQSLERLPERRVLVLRVAGRGREVARAGQERVEGVSAVDGTGRGVGPGDGPGRPVDTYGSGALCWAPVAS